MTLEWLSGSVELLPGYTLRTGAGEESSSVAQARIAVQGGFLHVVVPGAGVVQVVSAPAVRRVTYETPAA